MGTAFNVKNARLVSGVQARMVRICTSPQLNSIRRTQPAFRGVPMRFYSDNVFGITSNSPKSPQHRAIVDPELDTSEFRVFRV